MTQGCAAASQDFVFCKEVRLGSYSANAATLPPAAIVAAKAMAADPRAEPKHGERVPFVVRRQCWRGQREKLCVGGIMMACC
jgi:hypothetical protein